MARLDDESPCGDPDVDYNNAFMRDEVLFLGDGDSRFGQQPQSLPPATGQRVVVEPQAEGEMPAHLDGLGVLELPVRRGLEPPTPQ
ncbi:hypothetical protein ABZ192_07740 [Streptomyces sp. NPDC006235]|uniref:hypothetical protein n=1 Tax=Streptomyces sp. NPDC006235 TaxID=3156736 RepID=UPI0033B8AD87